MISILRASAGSGKTYQLAKRYISLLLLSRERDKYRHVLAVTFTNKATGEMKSRIVKELYTLATTPGKSPYINEFRADENFRRLYGGDKAVSGFDESIRKKAYEILTFLLHDYGAFSVSTIDSFFQSTIRAFAREIGHGTSYQVEVERDPLLEESVVRILDELSEDDPELLDYLSSTLENSIEEGSSHSLESQLIDTAKTLLSTQLRDILDPSGLDAATAFTRERVASIRKEAVSARKKACDTFMRSIQDVLKAFDEAGLSRYDFSRNCMDQVYLYADKVTKDNPFPKLSDALIAKAEDTDKWFRKKEAPALQPRADEIALPAFQSMMAQYERWRCIYLTCDMVYNSSANLGIASKVQEEFTALQKERNVLCLEDSNKLLRDIIEGSDTPFVYEKTGVRYENFLIDEFQDTSHIQWDNLRPLLKESEASGNENLIVGDIKQSIYRFRGSDWALLDSGVKADFPDALDCEPLSSNWRSLKNIVGFNNSFFKYSLDYLKGVNPDFDFESLYADVVQKAESKSSFEGRVEVCYCGKDEELTLVEESIRQCLDAGYDFGDIAVLVRKRKYGAAVAEYLSSVGIPVVSDDSAGVKSSYVVTCLSALLWREFNPDHMMAKWLESQLDVSPLGTGCSSVVDIAEAAARAIAAAIPGRFAEETLYIQAFMDEVHTWSQRYGNNLGAFLRYWDEADPVLTSPPVGNSVRVITIHKSKGLEFPCVILPFAEGYGKSITESHWAVTEESEDISFSGLPFYVKFSESKLPSTLFRRAYREDKIQSTVDNLNLLYVAMTRAESYMSIISAPPKTNTPADCILQYLTSAESLALELAPDEDHLNCRRFVFGEALQLHRKDKEVTESLLRASYESYPLNSAGEDGVMRGRLRISQDESSPRLRGVALHEVLSGVTLEEGLPEAIEYCRMAGLIPANLDVMSLLSDALASVRERGWFTCRRDAVLKEVSIADGKGNILRPDRVVTLQDGTVWVVDYKFGEHSTDEYKAVRNRYLRQVKGYMNLLSGMGYSKVRGAVWYVEDGVIDDI